LGETLDSGIPVIGRITVKRTVDEGEDDAERGREGGSE